MTQPLKSIKLFTTNLKDESSQFYRMVKALSSSEYSTIVVKKNSGLVFRSLENAFCETTSP